jgi:hypothetical protein
MVDFSAIVIPESQLGFIAVPEPEPGIGVSLPGDVPIQFSRGKVIVFTQASLSIAGILVQRHDFNFVGDVHVYDENGDWIYPDNVNTTATPNHITVDLFHYQPLIGNWRLWIDGN